MAIPGSNRAQHDHRRRQATPDAIPFLPALALIVPGLLAVAAVEAARAGFARGPAAPGRAANADRGRGARASRPAANGARRARIAIVTLCLAGAALALACLLAAPAPASLRVPLGEPGFGLVLALDGLSCWFILILFAVAAAAVASCSEASAAPLAAFVAALALTVLAGDGVALVLGLELTAVTGWGLMQADTAADGPEPAPRAGASPAFIGMAVLGALGVLGAIVLLAPALPSGFPDLRFASLRGTAPAGWSEIAVLALALFGAGSLAGLVPLHLWLPPSLSAAPVHAGVLMAGAMLPVALYTLLRLLLDLAGSAPPLGWGVALAMLGGFAALLGALRSVIETDLRVLLACIAIEQTGLVTIAIGVVLIGRAADLTSLASLALGAALLLGLTQGLLSALLLLAAGAVEQGAGTRHLHRLGGLAQRMPMTTLCALVGAAGLAAMPPGPGFAAAWLLFQALIGAARAGGVATQLALAAAAALLALALALGTVAALRLVGVGFLGRPRTPRTAAAEDPGSVSRRVMLVLATLALIIGLVPGLLLRLAGPAFAALRTEPMGVRAALAGLRAHPEQPGYAPLAIAALLAGLAAIAFVLLRRADPVGQQRGPAWDGGFAAPPPWLPFGDPLTQYGAASFSQILRRTIGARLLAARETVTTKLPGETSAARFLVTTRDPAAAWLLAAIAAARLWLWQRIDRLRPFPLGGAPALTLAALAALLAVLAWRGLR